MTNWYFFHYLTKSLVQVRTITIEKKKDIVKRINKTKQERVVDLAHERDQRDRKERAEHKKMAEEKVI